MSIDKSFKVKQINNMSAAFAAVFYGKIHNFFIINVNYLVLTNRQKNGIVIK